MNRARLLRHRLRALAPSLLALFVVACGTGGGAPPITYPPGTPPPATADSPAIGATRAQVVRAFADRGMLTQEPQTPFRPAEGPALAAAPRSILQVILPAEPAGGYLVIYELRDPPTATAAAQDQAAYLASGPGRVQTPIGTHHVIRQVGSTLILYSWNPDGATDERTPKIQEVLETIGVGIDVPA